jgi:hypothetical protein
LGITDIVCIHGHIGVGLREHRFSRAVHQPRHQHDEHAIVSSPLILACELSAPWSETQLAAVPKYEHLWRPPRKAQSGRLVDGKGPRIIRGESASCTLGGGYR